MYEHSRAGYSVVDAAELISVSRSQVYALMNRGEINSVHIGSRRIIPAAEIDRILGRTQTDTTNDTDVEVRDGS